MVADEIFGDETTREAFDGLAQMCRTCEHHGRGKLAKLLNISRLSVNKLAERRFSEIPLPDMKTAARFLEQAIRNAITQNTP